MSEFLGYTIIALSILGLTYSIGNIVIAMTKPLPVMHSLDNMLAFHKGSMIVKRKLTEVAE